MIPSFEAAVAPFDFHLPDDRIARIPPPERDGGRLLEVGPLSGDRALRDKAVRDLPSLLGPGDVLVVNDVRVHAARLRARRATGGNVEVLLVGGGEALLRPARRLEEGERLLCGPGTILLAERRADGRWRVVCEPDVDTLTAAAGEIPLPPYLGRAATPADANRYQTVFARANGDFRACAAPTAGLHLTPSLLAAVRGRGARVAHVTLEVGLGTFRPLAPEQIANGVLHPERYHIDPEAWDVITGRGRVVAVGTTVARALESASGPGAGVTQLFIREGYAFRRVDALFTNFHLPKSSLLMLVCAFGGRDHVLSAYQHAIATNYRFYSYGDAMFLSRA